MQTNELFDIANIVGAHLKGDLTADQQQVLNQWLQSSPKHQQLLDDLINKDALVAELKLFNSIKEGKQEILLQLPELFNKMPQQKVFHRIHFFRTAWFRYAAAAIIIISIGTYLYTTQTKPVPSKNIVAVHDVPAPSSNRATLTLANGREIF